MREFFEFQPRPEVFTAIVESFDKRVASRTKMPSSQQDKTCNHITALPATSGLGKSTILAHLAESPEYESYLSRRQRHAHESVRVSAERPVVSVLSFNSSMGYSRTEGNTLGLRIVYGALRHLSPNFLSWTEFLSHFAHHQSMSGLQAVQLLREVFGADRLLLLGIDELAKASVISNDALNHTVQEIMFELGRILNEDGRTDVLVTALSPMYAHSLITGSNRPIHYIPLPLLSHGELHRQFHSKVSEKIAEITALVQDKFQKNLLSSIDALTSGHPRMLEFLVTFMESNSGMKDIVKNTVGVPVTTLELLRGIALDARVTPLVCSFASEPTNSEERELILSVEPRNAKDDVLLRSMLEEGRCFIHDQVGSASSLLFRVTNTLSVFFRMLNTIDKTSEQELGPLSRAAKSLFATTKKYNKKVRGQLISMLPQISDVWECCRGMALVSTVHSILSKSDVVLASRVFGLKDCSKLHIPLWLQNDLQVQVVDSTARMGWVNNTLFLAPKCTSGFDILLCAKGVNGEKQYIYEESKIELSHVQDTIERVVARKLLLVVEHHLHICEVDKGAKLSKKQAVLQNVCFVLSVYGCEGPLKQATVLIHLEEARSNIASEPFVDIARYVVEKLWDRVAFLGTGEMELCMPPIVMPVARLVQTVGETV